MKQVKWRSGNSLHPLFHGMWGGCFNVKQVDFRPGVGERQRNRASSQGYPKKSFGITLDWMRQRTGRPRHEAIRIAGLSRLWCPSASSQPLAFILFTTNSSSFSVIIGANCPKPRSHLLWDAKSRSLRRVNLTGTRSGCLRPNIGSRNRKAQPNSFARVFSGKPMSMSDGTVWKKR